MWLGKSKVVIFISLFKVLIIKRSDFYFKNAKKPSFNEGFYSKTFNSYASIADADSNTTCPL